jgi:hypothetical protein
MTQGRWVAALACALAAFAAAPHVVAQAPAAATREMEARVVDVQGEDLVLDLGTSHGVVAGQKVELWRPLVLRHPVTKKTLQDRFLIGELELVQVRPTMTLARAVSAARPPEPGDVIVLQAAAPSVPVAPVPGARPPAPPNDAVYPPTPAGPPPDRAAEAVAQLLVKLEGATPELRARSYEHYARKNPLSPYAGALRAEAAALRAGAGGSAEARRGPRALTTAAVSEVRQGEPVRIAVEIVEAKGAVLHVRGPKDPTFVSIPMRPSGGDYWAADVPGASIDAPRLDWFVEGVAEDGRATAVLGASDRPMTTDVRPLPEVEAPSEMLASVSLWTDYADYNRFRGNDWAWQTEGEFGLRLADEGVRAVRSGFGVYRGEGGSVEELDELDLPPREVGLTYGYLEGEFAPTRFFAVLPRLLVGLGDDGVTGGAQLLFRIGHDQETNLQLGGEALGSVGVRGIAQLELETFQRFPILFRTEVTNQPAGADPSSDDEATPGDPRALSGSDIGARGIAQLGFRVVDELVISARGSFQGRTIQHAGPGFGGGVSYTW